MQVLLPFLLLEESLVSLTSLLRGISLPVFFFLFFSSRPAGSDKITTLPFLDSGRGKVIPRLLVVFLLVTSKASKASRSDNELDSPRSSLTDLSLFLLGRRLVQSLRRSFHTRITFSRVPTLGRSRRMPFCYFPSYGIAVCGFSLRFFLRLCAHFSFIFFTKNHRLSRFDWLVFVCLPVYMTLYRINPHLAASQ